MTIQKWLSCGFAAAFLAACGTAGAQGFPSKPVKFVVPFAAGSAGEIEARALGQHLERAWKTQILVEARPGAGGIVGTDYVAKSPPDGYTLLLAAGGLTTYHIFLKSVPFNAATDFEPISQIKEVPILLVANPGVPAPSMAELVAYARANPGKLNYGSAGRNTLMLLFERLKSAANIRMSEIPYQSTPQFLNALLRNDVQLVLAAAISVKPLIDAEKVRALAVLSENRLEILPNVRTMAEQGLASVTSTGWYGVFAPKGTPGGVVDAIASEIGRYAATPEAKARALAGGDVMVGSTPARFRAHLEREFKIWGEIGRGAGVQPE